ncbi:hypothetical protein IM792_02375 [Mucilaginibacter sp. JRF]|nr:hypothetical protein [Mucilaginibacter sp. JRF]MBE9583284.1 hypothetical protein [Mucilaginibacter sp. JRF]
MNNIEQPMLIHPTSNGQQYVYEYANGRRVLVEIDPVTGHIGFLREV